MISLPVPSGIPAGVASSSAPSRSTSDPANTHPKSTTTTPTLATVPTLLQGETAEGIISPRRKTNIKRKILFYLSILPLSLLRSYDLGLFRASIYLTTSYKHPDLSLLILPQNPHLTPSLPLNHYSLLIAVNAVTLVPNRDNSAHIVSGRGIGRRFRGSEGSGRVVSLGRCSLLLLKRQRHPSHLLLQ